MRSLCSFQLISIYWKVSTPSCGLGYKIAYMAYQRCKPCLCLHKRGGGHGEKSLKMLSRMISGDRMLDVSHPSRIAIEIVNSLGCLAVCVSWDLLERLLRRQMIHGVPCGFRNEAGYSVGLCPRGYALNVKLRRCFRLPEQEGCRHVCFHVGLGGTLHECLRVCCWDDLLVDGDCKSFF